MVKPLRRRPPPLKLLPPEDPGTAMPVGSPFRAVFRLLPYFLLTLAIIPFQALALALSRPLAQWIPYRYHRACCRLLGLRVTVKGEISRARPTLFVANHSSYLDITVFGSLIPGSFVAKGEIAGWPFFGWLAKLQRSVFVDRRLRSTHLQRDEMSFRLQAGENLILFPEGTSDDGQRVLPFRSALLSAAERKVGTGEAARALILQPVSVAYTRLNGVPLGYALRPMVAWYGAMELADHLWRMIGLGRIEAVVEFHPPVTIEDFGSRKALADHCYRLVAGGLASALSGRPQSLVLPPPRAKVGVSPDAARPGHELAVRPAAGLPIASGPAS